LLRDICALNPFTHAVELIRFALYQSFNGWALLWVVVFFAAFMAGSLIGYDPARGMARKKPGP
ncbi:MAG: multidrug ABC transporter permease, partial [Paracoccaceae bacterium]